jgi:hypothetical protein
MDLPYITLCLDLTHLNFPLRPLYVGRGGFLNLAVSGIDTSRFSASVIIGQVLDGAEPHRFDFDVSSDGKRFEKRVPGHAFLSAGAVPYEVHVYDTQENGAYCWAGRGKLTVRGALAAVEDPGAPPNLPPSFYVQHPVTMLWHKVVGALNSDGDLTFKTEEEGVENV